MKIRTHLLISGKVQGVFFRSRLQREATRLGVNGWVKNLSDGRVEAILEGEEREVNQVIKFCQRGPSHAKIESVTVKRESYTGEFHNFRIQWST
jgi:acylphosphatase